MGYYFAVPHVEHAAWYGFLPKDDVRGAGNQAELVIATSFPVELCSPSFKKVELVREQFLGSIRGKSRPVHAWTVEFNKEWASKDKWEQAMKPLHEEARKILFQSEEQSGPGAEA